MSSVVKNFLGRFVQFQGLMTRKLTICNSQGGVSLECHSVTEIGFGLRIFWDGGARL